MAKKENKKLIPLIIICGFLIALNARALEISWPSSPFGTVLTDSSSFTDLIRYFYEWGIAIGGIAVFIALLFGGFLYLTSAGDPGKLKEAKDRIFSAFIGLAILLGSWLILNTINPELVILKTPEANIPPMEISEISTSTFAAEPCDKAYIYGDVNYSGTSTEIVSSTQSSIDYQPKSAKLIRIVDSTEKICGEEIGCNCAVKMYEKNDCSGTVIYTLSVSSKDLTDALSEYTIKCIKVEKAF